MAPTLHQDHIPIPGSVHLVDLAGTLHALHDSRGGHKDVVLFPQPTSEYDDPLNWTKARKVTVATVLFIYLFAGNLMAANLSPALLLIEEELDIPLATINQAISVMFLMFGWSNLMWTPLATTYGRRPVFLVSCLGMIGVSIWTAHVKSSGEWYANRFIMGTFYGPLETLIELALSDIFFAHERGFYIGIYTWTLMGTPFIGSVAAGYVASSIGWRWIQYIAAIFGGAVFVAMFFFVEETMFYRAGPPDAELSLEAEEEGSPATAAVSGTTTQTAATLTDSDAKKSSTKTNTSSDEQRQRSLDIVQGTTTTNRKTALQRLKFWGARRPGQPHELLRGVWMPFTLARFPLIVFAGCLTGSVLAWYNVVMATIAYVLSAAPYNFSTDGTGLILLAPFIGCSIGCLIAGFSANRLALWMARRNGGSFEPEHRLWMAAVVFLIHPVGCILYGVGAQRGIHWIGLAFGLGFVVGCFPISSTVAINYIIDAGKEIAAEGLVTMILIRNTIGFAFTYAVTPWITASGVQNTFIACGFIGMFIAGCTFIFIVWGRRFRQQSAKSYWHMVQKHGFKAH